MAGHLNFGGILRRIRRGKNLNISEAAKKSGLTEKRYEDIEGGSHEPRAGDFLRILRALNINSDAFEPEDFDKVSQ